MDEFEQIDKLAKLKEKGIITEEEFQLKKKQLLSIEEGGQNSPKQDKSDSNSLRQVTPAPIGKKAKKKTGNFRKGLFFIFILIVVGYCGHSLLHKGPNTIGRQTSLSNLIKSPEDIMLENIQKAMDVSNPVTRDFAVQIASKFPGNYSLDQICSIYDYLFRNWKYVNDPRGFDYFAPASESIKAGLAGDCDDYAILMATLIESIGGRARILCAYGPQGAHAFAEADLGNVQNTQLILKAVNNHYAGLFQKILGISKVETVNFHKDNDGRIWLNLDWTSKYPGGPFYKFDRAVIYYPRENYYQRISQ